MLLSHWIQLVVSISFRHVPSYYEAIRSGGSAFFSVFAPSGASCNGGFFTCPYTHAASASNLSRGQALSTRPFVPFGGVLAGRKLYQGLCGYGYRGQFQEPGIAFIGFKFNNGNGDQYGWAQIGKSTYLSNFRFRLLDYAYGDVGDRVKVGQMSDADTPELESLGGLALGAAGLLAWRKRRSKIAAI